ncbi:MAG TPA: Uma2 family endonuclease [Planctomycetota bacterium]|nr:Uma2 family endonuclease [Planctomycetota bacterium]
MSAPAYDRVLAERSTLESLLEERRRNGLDKRDEVWEGVLYLVPPAHDEHGSIMADLIVFLGPIAARLGGRLLIEPGLRNPGSGEWNFRVPDLVYVSAEDERLRGTGWVEGGPSVVFEIRSPRDDTYKKFPFYAGLGVRELVVVDRQTLRVEVFKLAGEGFVAAAQDANGRVPLAALGVRFVTRLAAKSMSLFGLDDTSPDRETEIHRLSR